MGTLKKNPGPKPNACQGFSVCHCNLNSISSHNFFKLSLLGAYINLHNFVVICLSDTHLDSSILHDDDNLKIAGFNIYREGRSSFEY